MNASSPRDKITAADALWYRDIKKEEVEVRNPSIGIGIGKIDRRNHNGAWYPRSAPAHSKYHVGAKLAVVG